MPNRRGLFLAATALALTGALAPWLMFATTTRAYCLNVDHSVLVNVTRASSMIVVGSVREYKVGDNVAIDPEAFLKGPAQSGLIRLTFPDPGPDPKLGCSLALFTKGDRVLAFVGDEGGTLGWPGANEVYVLSAGRAQAGGNSPTSVAEADLIAQIRGLTNQFAVPAGRDDGAGIDWGSTIIPMALASAGLLLVGLFLMRIWHRIDPS